MNSETLWTTLLLFPTRLWTGAKVRRVYMPFTSFLSLFCALAFRLHLAVMSYDQSHLCHRFYSKYFARKLQFCWKYRRHSMKFFKVVDKAVIMTSGVGSLLLQDQEFSFFSSQLAEIWVPLVLDSSEDEMYKSSDNCKLLCSHSFKFIAKAPLKDRVGPARERYIQNYWLAWVYFVFPLYPPLRLFIYLYTGDAGMTRISQALFNSTNSWNLKAMCLLNIQK